jgi:molecular chaperone GrpE
MSDKPSKPTGPIDVASTQEMSPIDVLKGRLQMAEQQRDEAVALLKEAQLARDDYFALVKETRADFENYQKRARRDQEAERKYAQMPLAGDLLQALDNLERAIGAAGQAGDKGPLAQGVGMVQTQLLDALKRHGVTRMDAQGKPFDPNLHQAVQQQPSAEHPPQTVLQVLEPGYLLHERVLRPARVIVSTKP